MVFEDYASFYDWLYQDKDYRAECDFIQRVFRMYDQREIKTILDLGCGTGSHTLLFADMSYRVTGVDCSEKMLQLAENKAAAQNKQVHFCQGDIRYLDLAQKFDAVVAMFTVLGYQTSNEDVENTLKSVRRHLHSGGLFVFDVWFGPAVLQEKPTERVKIIEHGEGKIIRCARPVLDIINHVVEVNYTVFEARGSHLAEVTESHLVRFFFYQELRYFLERNGFEVLKICPFMNLDGQLDEHCWTISVISRAV